MPYVVDQLHQQSVNASKKSDVIEFQVNQSVHVVIVLRSWFLSQAEVS